MIVVVVCARPSHLSFLSSRKLLLELGCVNVNSSVKQDGPISHGVCKEVVSALLQGWASKILIVGLSMINTITVIYGGLPTCYNGPEN
ncbi:hypothetical protein NC653_002437 [Populus alba x Populus x berolinensis]|nr:hypothetical protein NC653_007162 [Populus alba x Populus x berolinensis]KAJ7012379.1 hypothetical protein NC653_002437 [Populus alba x Populus x berolinensis]